ncbi:hypothetical protein G7Y89_g4862 [Cudoniella acicularis]|uniref:Velvet domain-containing protein n=1 Tax=Cudoniella acicularis TaxID=354080 RepID=A0A8H4RPX4_9HELO|nr:hypothetical protein G7Y89_g4862 [Cudoniella acicularis]
MAQQKPIEESDALLERTTKEGRRITYALNVIQQPERARACGSGAKSSADRRPVDPPPVVELRIYENVGTKQQEDITFSYSANFFLFATLETARTMAHGRSQPSPPQIPVLTGMPVSGMAYLDRPNEAGYFIFPDLSVRHEGKYYLSFNLYEETKRDGDGDPEAEPKTEQKPKVPAPPGAPDSSFDWRLEVKSAMFTVFSAKKFPGLAESTPLSRTVAEQGCRVRIRRDVRMRRRDKPAGEYDEPADDGYSRAGRPAEPEPYRERSNSAVGDEGRESQRRLSGEYPAQPYQPAFSPSPVAGHTPPPPGGYLGFMGGGGGGNFGQQFQAPQGQFSQPPPPPPPPATQQAYQSAPNAYHQQQAHSRPAPPPPSNYGYDHRYPPHSSAYSANPPREQRDEPDPYRKASAPYPSNAQSSGPYPAVDPTYHRPQYPPAASPVNLAPINLPPIEHKYEAHRSPTGPLSAVRTVAPPLPSPSFDRGSDRSAAYAHYSGPAPGPTIASSAGPMIVAAEPPAPMEPMFNENGKRPRDRVFGEPSSYEPLHDGQRPSLQENSSCMNGNVNRFTGEMEYKRADGSGMYRICPADSFNDHHR